MSTHRALAVVLAMVSVLTGSARATAQMIPAGKESLVVALVGESLRAAEFSPDVNIRIDENVIRFPVAELAEGSGPPPEVEVAAPDGEVADGRSAIGAGIGLRCEPKCSTGQLTRAEGLARALEKARASRVDAIWSKRPKPSPVKTGVLGQPVELPDPPWWVWSVFLAFVAGAAGTVGSVLAQERRRPLLALAGLTALGAVLRVLLTDTQLMGVLAHNRELPWLYHLKRAGVPVLSVVPEGAGRFEQQAIANLVLSVLLVPIVYVHARAIFRDSRRALVAAGVMTCLPMAVAFSRSEIFLLSSVFFTSIAFTALERFTKGPAWAAWVFGATALVAFALAIESRPLNVLLWLVFLPALWFYAGKDWRRPRTLGWLALGLGMVIYAALRLAQLGRVSEAPVVMSKMPGTSELWLVLLELPALLGVHNNYLIPDIAPLWLTVAAGVGVVACWRRRRGLLLYLGGWFLVIFIGHALVGAHTRLMAARYGLHTLVPLVLLAAEGVVVAVERFQRWRPDRPGHRMGVLAAVALVVLGSTVFTARLLGPVNDDVNVENRFLEELWAKGIPEPGSLVVEVYDHNEAPRYAYVGRRIRSGKEEAIVASASELRDHEGPVYLYWGLPCLWRREGHRVSPSCEAARAGGSYEVVASQSISAPLHDRSSGRVPADGGEVVLYRLAAP